jgi:predicted glutamine amidotransferase
MCELMGLNFNQAVRCSLSFRGFRHRSEENPDGWGIARFEGKASQVFKEPISATRSRLSEFVRDYEAFVSRIFIGHVRQASRGAHTLENTHPFVRVFRQREVVFAHNGTLNLPGTTGRLTFRPVGETDSERLFCELLSRLSVGRVPLTEFEIIEVLLRGFNSFGTMNLLFSEGEHLYVYHDRAGYNGLCMTERSAPFGHVRLQDEDWSVDLNEEKHPGQRGVVIATSPLTNEQWTDLTPGSLWVFKDGQRVYGD